MRAKCGLVLTLPSQLEPFHGCGVTITIPLEPCATWHKHRKLETLNNSFWKTRKFGEFMTPHQPTPNYFMMIATWHTGSRKPHRFSRLRTLMCGSPEKFSRFTRGCAEVPRNPPAFRLDVGKSHDISALCTWMRGRLTKCPPFSTGCAAAPQPQFLFLGACVFKAVFLPPPEECPRSVAPHEHIGLALKLMLRTCGADPMRTALCALSPWAHPEIKPARGKSRKSMGRCTARLTEQQPYARRPPRPTKSATR
jgi:hypothetical protein